MTLLELARQSLRQIMTANRATRLEPAFAAAVAEVEPALATWRKRRKNREPIPEPLWSAMVRLAQAYRPSPVAQALRVNYSALKCRIKVNPLPRADANQLSYFGP
jgi:hypothetical protein